MNLKLKLNCPYFSYFPIWCIYTRIGATNGAAAEKQRNNLMGNEKEDIPYIDIYVLKCCFW